MLDLDEMLLFEERFLEIIYYYLKEARSITLGSGAEFPGIVGGKKAGPKRELAFLEQGDGQGRQ